MFKYTLDNKRYHTLNYFYRTKFNNKVFKVPLDAHMSCPNKLNGKITINNIRFTIITTINATFTI